MAKAITTKAVEAMKLGPNRREIPDPARTGLYLVVQPSGAQSWALRYRYAGEPKKLTLGKWPVMGTATAGAAASEALEAVNHGNDPGAAKKKEKVAQRTKNRRAHDVHLSAATRAVLVGMERMTGGPGYPPHHDQSGAPERLPQGSEPNC